MLAMALKQKEKADNRQSQNLSYFYMTVVQLLDIFFATSCICYAKLSYYAYKPFSFHFKKCKAILKKSVLPKLS